mgnify:FL=1
MVDEAYIEFSGKKSCIELLEKFPSLIVLQTFSKAWGMAGARVGIAYASEEIIQLINTVKSPYNVNYLSLNKISELITNKEFIKSNIENTLNEIFWLRNELETINCIKKVFPSDANFFLIQFENVDKVYQKLLENDILTSKRSPQIPDCIRINVGNREENNKLINVLKSI